jgi:hypothetical protein
MTKRRALRRAAWAALALVALACLRIALGKSLGGWVAARERARFEREVGPLDPATLAAPEVADADNAVPAILDAVARIGLGDDEKALLARVSAEQAPGAADLAQLDDLRERSRAALDALARAAARPASSFGPRTELFHARDLDLVSWLTAARLVALDAERGLAAGEPGRFGTAIATLHGLTVTLRREPLTVFALVGHAIERIELDLVRTDLARAPASSSLRDLARRLDELRRLPSSTQVMRGEVVFGHDMLRRTPVVPRATGTVRERIEALLWPWSEGHVEAGYLSGYRDLARLAALPQVSWPPTAALLRARPGRIRAWLDPIAPLDLYGPWLLPELLELVRRAQHLESSELLAALAVELAQRSAELGELPDSLAGFAQLGTDAVAGEVPVYRLGSDGAGVLELPTARDLLERERASKADDLRRAHERRLRLTRWHVAPPRPADPRGAPPPVG